MRGGPARCGGVTTTGCETEGRGPTVGIPGPLAAAAAADPPEAPPGPAEAPDGLLSKLAEPNGELRERVSVPYQNSVLSDSGRAWVRMMCGVIDSTISLFSRSLLFEANSRPTIGIWLKPGIPAELRVSESWMRPANICVSPSFNRNKVLALRVPMV